MDWMFEKLPQLRYTSFSADLYGSCKLYRRMCKTHQSLVRDLKVRENFTRVTYRLVEYWLPLMATEEEVLFAPDDILLVWHLFMLSHKDYEQHCRKHFKKALSWDLLQCMTNKDNSFLCAKSKALWKVRYPHEAYDLDLSSPSQQQLNYEIIMLSKKLYDMLQYHQQYSKQVMLPHFENKLFIREAISRYVMYLELRQKFQHTELTPTVDIEFIWRAHVLQPSAHAQDCKNFIGFIPTWHGGVPREEARSRIKELWYTHYRTNYIVPGCHFLPEAPLEGLIVPLKVDYCIRDGQDNCDITISDVTVADLWSRDKRIVVEGRRLGVSSHIFDTVFRVEGQQGKLLHKGPKGNLEPLKLACTKFDTSYHRGIEFHIYGRKGFGCVSAEQHLGAVLFDPRKSFEDERFRDKVWVVEVPRCFVTDPTITFTCDMKTVATQPLAFGLYREPFVQEPLSQDVLQVVAHSTLWNQSAALDMDGCYVAKHGLIPKRNVGGDFQCHVIRLNGFSLASILLYHEDTGLVCAAYSIGQETLPSPEEVDEDSKLSLDSFCGDQAMMIRNSEGNWGICVIKQTTDPDEDQMHVIFHHLGREDTQECKVNVNGQGGITFESVNCDMRTGNMTLSPNCQEVAENITLAFVTGALCVLAQRRINLLHTSRISLGNIPSETLFPDSDPSAYDGPKHKLSRFSHKMRLNRESAKRLKRIKRRRSSFCCTFFLACGFQADLWEGLAGHVSGTSSVRSNISQAALLPDGDSKSLDSDYTLESDQVLSNGEELINSDTFDIRL